MDTERFIRMMDSGEKVTAGSETHQYMVHLTNEAMKITARLNQGHHGPEEIRELMAELTGQEIDDTFGMFPPFYTDCGKNIHIGKHVFINSGCQFQDQGGIYIGDGTLIGHSVVLATLDHDLDPAHRADLYPKPIHIGKNVWIGAHATVTQGGDHWGRGCDRGRSGRDEGCPARYRGGRRARTQDKEPCLVISLRICQF